MKTAATKKLLELKQEAEQVLFLALHAPNQKEGDPSLLPINEDPFLECSGTC